MEVPSAIGKGHNGQKYPYLLGVSLSRVEGTASKQIIFNCAQIISIQRPYIFMKKKISRDKVSILFFS